MYKLKLVREYLEDSVKEYPAKNPAEVREFLVKNCFTPETSWTESLWLLTVDGKANIVSKTLLSTGGVNNVIIDTRVVVKYALDAMAGAVIIAHNHPSGNALPSASDIQQTDKLRKALALFDIKMLDHIIVSDKDYFSFTDENLVKTA